MPVMRRLELRDSSDGETVGVGVVRFGLRRASNLRWQSLDVDRWIRASLKDQQPTVLWFTGLSGAGKSTIADIIEWALGKLLLETTDKCGTASGRGRPKTAFSP